MNDTQETTETGTAPSWRQYKPVEHDREGEWCHPAWCTVHPVLDSHGRFIRFDGYHRGDTLTVETQWGPVCQVAVGTFPDAGWIEGGHFVHLLSIHCDIDMDRPDAASSELVLTADEADHLAKMLQEKAQSLREGLAHEAKERGDDPTAA